MYSDRTGRESSPWHSLLLHAENGALHFVCTIPRYSRLQLDFGPDEWLNPSRVNAREANPSGVLSPSWNIGFLPQTISLVCPTTDQENEPLLVIDIGRSKNRAVSEVYPVKPLTTISITNSLNQVSWIIIAVSVEETRSGIHSFNLPFSILKIREWMCKWRLYDSDLLTLNEIVENSSQEVLDFVISASHAKWKANVDKVANALDPPLAKSVGPSNCEKAWHRQSNGSSEFKATAMGAPLMTWSSNMYEQAWAEFEESDFSHPAGNSIHKSTHPQECRRKNLSRCCVSGRSMSLLPKWRVPHRETRRMSNIKFSPSQPGSPQYLFGPKQHQAENEGCLVARPNAFRHSISTNSADASEFRMFEPLLFSRSESYRDYQVGQDQWNNGPLPRGSSEKSRRGLELNMVAEHSHPIRPEKISKFYKLKQFLCKVMDSKHLK